MGLGPDSAQTRARALVDLRMGVPVALRFGERVALALAAETLDRRRLDELAALGAEIGIAITARRAEALGVQLADGGFARLDLPPGAGLEWIASVCDPTAAPLAPAASPGARAAAEDGPHALALELAKEALLLPAALVADVPDDPDFAAAHGLTVVDAAAHAAPGAGGLLRAVATARIPLAAGEGSRLNVFRTVDGAEEHCAVEIGQPSRDEPALARIHSACFTGDVMGSLKCDCGPQLRAAMQSMGADGGVLLYLSQEGRGIGLANKIRAYSIQDRGFDTYEANHHLGFEDDERDFRIGAEILKLMGFSAVRLLTNNPAKIEVMERSGIKVAERVPLHVGETDHNRGYLAAKAKSGHLA